MNNQEIFQSSKEHVYYKITDLGSSRYADNNNNGLDGRIETNDRIKLQSGYMNSVSVEIKTRIVHFFQGVVG